MDNTTVICGINDPNTGRELELTQDELETLRYIGDCIPADGMNQPPTQDELLAHLILQGLKLVSTEQTQRMANSLRRKGLLVNPLEDARWLGRNMILTPLGWEVIAAIK